MIRADIISDRYRPILKATISVSYLWSETTESGHPWYQLNIACLIELKLLL